jgi:hypothetical protein
VKNTLHLKPKRLARIRASAGEKHDVLADARTARPLIHDEVRVLRQGRRGKRQPAGNRDEDRDQSDHDVNLQ